MNAQNLRKRVLKISWDHWVSLFFTPTQNATLVDFSESQQIVLWLLPACYAEGWGSYLSLSTYQLGTKMQQALLQ